MESLSNQLSKLAKDLNLTWLDEEPIEYTLTPDEENAAIENELQQIKRYYAWKLKDRGLNTQAEMDLRLNQTNWDEHLDKDAILERANANKAHQLWQAEQEQARKKREENRLAELKQTWTAKIMFQFMRWSAKEKFGKTLIVDGQTTPLIKTLCYFLSGDTRFETELGYTFKKGLLIRGNCGLGKTFLVKCLEENMLNPVLVLSMIEIADKIKHDGAFEIGIGNKQKIYIDDVGSEEVTVNHYGTKINWFKEFIETFYLRSDEYNKLILSTNVNFAGMETLYGFRLRSRAKDMFNVIDVTGKDLRG